MPPEIVPCASCGSLTSGSLGIRIAGLIERARDTLKSDRMPEADSVRVCSFACFGEFMAKFDKLYGEAGG